MERNSVISLPYFGNLHWYQCLLKFDPLIEAHENYQKKSWRNKTEILSANGPIVLSVPLKKGKHAAKPYKEVQISYEENWVRNHLISIHSAYGNSAYFEHYYHYFEKLLSQDFELLWELNLEILQVLNRLLPFGESQNLTENFIQNTTNLIDCRNEKRIKIQTKEIYYPQVFEDKYGYVAGLSILDILFNTGPETLSILKSSIKTS